MNTGQTVYEQLQEMLNKCIKLGWKPFGIDTQVQRSGLGNHWGYIGGRGEPIYCSNHDLFSKDSGIVEFVEWEENASMGVSSDRRFHIMVMSHLSAEEKVKYFVNNAKVPTK